MIISRNMIIVLIVAFSIPLLVFEYNLVFAEETKSYKMADDVTAILTFKFRDGIETHEFPIFKTTSDFVANEGTFFEIQGVVGNAPHLHKALDESFKFRLMKTTGKNSFEYNYRFFDIDVAFVKDGESVKTILYDDCQIVDYNINTLSHLQRAYLSSKTGFAIIDTIEFQCAGMNSDIPHKIYDSNTLTTGITSHFDKLGYQYAENVNPFVTFEFVNGKERIEFPIFVITSGFKENSAPSFHVEGIVNQYPLLGNAIDNARGVSKIPSTYNTDFNAKVEFIQGTMLGGEKLLRQINYEDCHITSAEINTYHDTEEGFTGKSGFAIVDTIDFDCAGLAPVNPRYDVIYHDAKISEISSGTTLVANEQLNNNYNMGTGPHAVAVFKFKDNTIEIIDFPIFKQGAILSKTNPSFELKSILGDFPLLYKRVDKAAKINQITGVNQSHELFNVDVNLKYGDQLIRGFSYSDCRVIDYVVKTEHDKEEGFFNGFALENTFKFECFRYVPKNPVYDAMFEVDTAETLNSLKLRDTTTWDDLFKHTKK